MERKQKNRSRAYPYIALDEALSRTENIRSNLGFGYYNRESIAIGMGYKSLNGASSRAIAALTQYNLLEHDKENYRLSEVARKYLLPEDEQGVDSKMAIQQAALSPRLFADIFEQNNGQILPRQLENILVSKFGIQDKVSTEVAKLFRRSMEVADLLQGNGLLQRSGGNNDGSYNGSTNSPTDAVLAPPPTHNGNTGQQHLRPAAAHVITLPSGVTVGFPESLAFALATGKFAAEIEELETKAQQFKTTATDEQGKGPNHEDETEKDQ